MRQLLSKTIHHSSVGAKKLLNKSPRIKRALKRVVYAQLGIKNVETYKYQEWLHKHFPDFIEISKLRGLAQEFSYKPLISIVVPTYNTDPEFLKDCIESVLGQVYENWELCIVDDASPDANVRKQIQEYAAKDRRINYKFLKDNQHISGASNEAAKLAQGEFISLLDHDDILWPNALYEVVKVLNENKDLDLIYTDEDKITEKRHQHLGPFFKPDWNPDFLRSVNYITHFTTIRKSVLEQVGGFKEQYNGAQDWDLFLRIIRLGPRL